MYERLPDWEARLAGYLAAHADACFAWGRLDCALFAAGAVVALTGEDPAVAFRGRYRTSRGSVRALRKIGQQTLAATVEHRFPATPIGYARRGDLVMVDGMVGVCVGAEAVFVGEADGAPGLVRYPRERWSTAWSVG